MKKKKKKKNNVGGGGNSQVSRIGSQVSPPGTQQSQNTRSTELSFEPLNYHAEIDDLEDDRLVTQDGRAHHIMTGCPYEGGRIQTHNALCGECQQLAVSNGMRVIMEEKGTLGANGRKPDMSIEAGQFGNNKKVLLDVMVTAPINSKTNGKVTEAGTAAEAGYRKKMREYNELAEQNQHEFQPIIIESTGRIHKKSLKFLKRLLHVKEADQSLKSVNARFFRYWLTGFSVTLQKGLANAFIRGKNGIRRAGNLHPAVFDHFSNDQFIDYCVQNAAMDAPVD
jgi:hypothetical protein